MTDKAKKALVIGLDGVPYTLLVKYMETGAMPNLKRIMAGGYALHQMDASIPEVSSTSWTSFMTGVNPGEHGIYGFMELRPGTYKLYFPNYRDISAPAIWDIIGGSAAEKRSTLSEEHGPAFSGKLRSVALNIPQTFPAPELNGVLTAGFVCPDLRKGTYPQAAFEYLTGMGYIPDVDAAKAVEDPAGFFTEVDAALAKRAEAYGHFMAEEPWDLFVGVITETDRLQHFFFDAALDEAHPRHGQFMAVYAKIDGMIGSIFDSFMEMTSGEGLFMTMSDHGFTVIDKEVYLNMWLRDKGYLTLDPGRGEYYEQVAPGSRAFCMDPARIYLNMEGAFPAGSVKAHERDGLVEELKSGLLSITDNGAPVVKAVYGRHELYSGPLLDRAPDLVCLPHDGYDLKGVLKREGVFGRSHFRGMHTRFDAHCLMPGDTALAGRLHIEALAGIILRNFMK